MPLLSARAGGQHPARTSDGASIASFSPPNGRSRTSLAATILVAQEDHEPLRVRSTVDRHTEAHVSIECPNCGTVAAGRYCPGCGQRDAVVAAPFRNMIRELVRESLELEDKLLMTLRCLVNHPGSLTTDYLAGRRVRYVHPARLYLFASVVLGAALAYASNVFVVFADDGSRDEAGRLLILRGWLWSVLVSVPIFATLLHAMYRRSGRYFTEHFVFALHFHAFAFLLASPTLVTLQLASQQASGWTAPLLVTVAFLLSTTIYMGMALRNAYSDRLRVAAARGLAILVAYGAVQVFSMALVGLLVSRLSL